MLYSYEDYSLEEVTDPRFENKHDLYLGKSAERYDVLILRDPFNLLASRLKKDKIKVRNPNETLVELWISYAKEYLGKTEYLNNNFIVVNYNQWFSDVDYRQRIASALKLNFSDAGINEVKSYGGGSSFEEREFDGKATEMDVLSRWKEFADDKLYRDLLDNEDLLGYSRQIFGHIPGTESLKLKHSQ